MNRIELLSAFHGIFGMVVCAEKDASDDEILSFCNKENPSGTTNGWVQVVRNDSEHPQCNPVQCADNPERLHIIVNC